MQMHQTNNTDADTTATNFKTSAAAANHHHHHLLQTLTLDSAKSRHRSRSRSHSRSNSCPHSRSQSPCPAARDPTSSLSDELLLRILSHLPDDHLHLAASLVSRRWLRLSGHLRRSLTLLSWAPLDRLLSRFPNLTDLNLLPASFLSPIPSFLTPRVVLNRGNLSIPLDERANPLIGFCTFDTSDEIDQGLQSVAKRCPNLRKLAVAGSELGLVAVAEACDLLQEMEIQRCTDSSLKSVSGFKNLQILKLVGSVEGLFNKPGVTDIGLTFLAHGCKRLVKLELSGCEGSYDGISAIGRCCLMLEELTLTNHRMDAGWMAGLSFCGNLKTLRLQSCRRIDEDPGPEEHLGTCPTIETIQMLRCQLRDKRSLRALFMMCESAREIMFQNCWGLDNEMFGTASICR